jgi:2-keto-4-pentenoate hydratase/2-oxohepta-3-ene-1,7-dioic acid hydratase in catechol pathway
MRLVTVSCGGRAAAGIIVGTDVLNIAAAAAAIPAARCIPDSVRGILQAGDTALDLARKTLDDVLNAAGSLREQLIASAALTPLASTKLLAPVQPQLVLSCGMNYRAHLHEMGGALPDKPTAFAKSVSAVVGPDASIVLPEKYPDMVDWEAEFSGVIGRRCHNVTAAEALDYVAGYTMINDVSARNWVKPMGGMPGMEAIQAWDLNLLGKQFPSFCPMGPSIATKDEIADPNTVHFELKINGEVMQSACTDDLVFDLAALIAYYSQWYVFEPGDVITTGSPAGVGMGRKPWVFLKAGDIVEISAAGIGSMRNPVVAHAAK